jgi:hypothetical protein
MAAILNGISARVGARINYNDDRDRGATLDYYDLRVKVESLQLVTCAVKRVSDWAVALGVDGRII